VAVTWAVWLVPLALLALGTPIYLCFLAGGVLILTLIGMPSFLVPQVMFGSLESFTLMAIPFFLFAGELMGRGGIAERLIRWFMAMFRGVRGGLGLATVGAAIGFGAISGATVATVATVGRIMYPGLRQSGYGERFSLGLITATGAIDALIPPSILMVLYGVAAEQSIAKLFIAGIIPGLLLGGVQAAYVIWYAHRNRIPVGEPASVAEVARSTVDASWALAVPVVILGGIYTGVFTPTEAAGIAVVIGLFSGLVVYRDMTASEVWNITIATGRITAQILIIVTCSSLYAWLLTSQGVPQRLTAAVEALALPSWAILLVLNVILLFAGMLIDLTSATLILTPLFVPIIKAAGVDPIHFGIILTTNLGLGSYTPPMAPNIFTTQSMLNVPAARIIPGLMPFIVLHLIVIGLITYVPGLSLWLVR
jgi:C4-dicarboxylate transporter, DctM subunit